jgi:hypothetical protein
MGMRLQIFAAAHNWTVLGEAEAQKDRFARYYIDGRRVALARSEGLFTTLICADGQTHYVMTSDWHEVEGLAGSDVLNL